MEVVELRIVSANSIDVTVKLTTQFNNGAPRAVLMTLVAAAAASCTDAALRPSSRSVVQPLL